MRFGLEKSVYGPFGSLHKFQGTSPDVHMPSWENVQNFDRASYEPRAFFVRLNEAPRLLGCFLERGAPWSLWISCVPLMGHLPQKSWGKA